MIAVLDDSWFWMIADFISLFTSCLCIVNCSTASPGACAAWRNWNITFFLGDCLCCPIVISSVRKCVSLIQLDTTALLVAVCHCCLSLLFVISDVDGHKVCLEAFCSGSVLSRFSIADSTSWQVVEVVEVVGRFLSPSQLSNLSSVGLD